MQANIVNLINGMNAMLRNPYNGRHFSEVLGAKSCILAKNVDDLYTEDPNVNPSAEFIPEITAEELLRKKMDDMVLERMVVEQLLDAKHVKEVKIVNGPVQGNVTGAITGEKVGTVVRK
jgi:molybdenum storage protein